MVGKRTAFPMRALAFAAPLFLVPFATHGSTFLAFLGTLPYPAWGFLASLAAAVIVGRHPTTPRATDADDANAASA